MANQFNALEVGQLLKGLTGDYYRQIQVLEAYLADIDAAPPFPGKRMIRSQVVARLAAARRNFALQEEGEEATRQWRFLGMSSGTGVVAALGALTLLLVSKSK